MTFLKIIVLLFFASQTSLCMSQEIESNTWENRVLLIITQDNHNTTFSNQIKELQANENGLSERKVKIYQVKKELFKLGLKNSLWQKPSNLYKKFNKENVNFKVVLIGLDGGVKLSKTNFVSCKKLFSFIDIMPMRREEIKTKNN